jgi:N-acetylglucosamine-6-phosphate deacetylase
VTELSGTIVTSSLAHAGTVRFSERIETVTVTPNNTGKIILPGFLDLHIHGGGGADCMDGEAAVRQVARFHAQHGTTGFLATTITAPIAEIEAALQGINAVIQNPQAGEAKVLGVHLEGPFINPNKLGAQPPFALKPDLGLMRHWMSLAPIKVVTLAVELEGALELIELLTASGVRVQQGHTIATYEQAKAGLEAGAQGFTHFYNAMSGLNHREPGVVGLALERSQWAEVIPDGLHVHPAAIRTAWKNIPHTYAVTDAAEAAGMPDGEYHLGQHKVYRKENGVFLADGTLAGSALTMGQAAKNLHAWGYSRHDILNMTGGHAAQYLGIEHALEPNNPADLVVLNEQFELEAVYVTGSRLK